MTQILKYRAPLAFSDHDSEKALYNRSVKKICRKCKVKLAINSNQCSKCHSKDLRIKHKLRYSNGGYTGYGKNSSRTINLKEFKKRFKF